MRIEFEEGAHRPDWRFIAERRAGKIVLVENGQLLKEYTAERFKRPPEHNHENELPGRPVLGFDLHRTLTPDYGFPLVSPPFTGVKAFMDMMVSRGCCIHVMSASLDRADPQVVSARKAMITSWALQYGLPIGFIGPNVEANVRLDDRGVTVSGDSPDWAALGRQAQKQLLDTWILDPDTDRYLKRADLVPVGDPIGTYPEITDILPDSPRGWSTPMLDIDIHRTINPGWGSTREDSPEPQAIRAIQAWYDAGFQIQVSCAGWMWSTHTQAQVEQRLASFRVYFRKWGIPYDRIVTKDDVDIWFDDKTIGFTSWKQAIPVVTAALTLAAQEHPAYATGRTFGSAYQRSESASADIEPEIKSAPANSEIHIHMPEGLVQFAEGAIQSNFAAPGSETEFEYDGDGRVRRVRKH